MAAPGAKKGPSKGLIIGLIAGGGFFLILIVAIGVVAMKKDDDKADEPTSEVASSDDGDSAKGKRSKRSKRRTKYSSSSSSLGKKVPGISRLYVPSGGSQSSNYAGSAKVHEYTYRSKSAESVLREFHSLMSKNGWSVNRNDRMKSLAYNLRRGSTRVGAMFSKDRYDNVVLSVVRQR